MSRADSTDSSSPVFVYGTLRRGERANALLATSRFAGEGWTPPSYKLVHMGEYPALLAGGNTAVLGEVYQVDAATLAVLDDYEDHPDFYRRQWLALADGTEVQAYVLPVAYARGKPEIPSGDWCKR
mgnify:CR=1 FL=1